MKNIVFYYNPYNGEQNATTKTVEFEDSATYDEIDEALNEWVLEQVADHISWDEEEVKRGGVENKIEIADNYYFDENRVAHSADNLDNKIAGGEKGAPTLREYIQYGIDSEYITVDKPLEELTTEELSHAVDFIDYLETK